MDSLTVSWNTEDDVIEIIDQTLLPGEVRIIRCDTTERLALAIQRLEVRGAPALGVAGAYGICLVAAQNIHRDYDDFFKAVHEGADLLKSTRPTAVNLAWGIDRVLDAMIPSSSPAESAMCAALEAKAIKEEDAAHCHAIGEAGAALLPDKCTVLTHCNAGALACSEWGTALGVIRSAVKSGKSVEVISCETRPLNQGSRLTAWELAQDSIPVKTITDSSAAHLMRKGMIDAVVVGADRITHDVVFNKIGTYMHAVCARYHNIPFYVAAPYSTFDFSSSEEDVIIELRGREELAFCGDRKLMPDGVDTINYAFDATPLKLVSAIITEKGVLKPPYKILPGLFETLQ